MKFSKPFTCHIVDTVIDIVRDGKSCKLEQKKALLQFPTAQNEEVLVKVGISAVDIKGAQRNVETEIPSWDFDSIMTATQISGTTTWKPFRSKETTKLKNKYSTQLYTTRPYTRASSPMRTDATAGRIK